jgi:hypothetical protein
MKSTSTTRVVLVLVWSISLITTGCTAQWISVALADLPGLSQMRFQTRKQETRNWKPVVRNEFSVLSYFRRQRTPSLVISTRSPAVMSSARIASEA